MSTYHKDNAGVPYASPDGKPAGGGVQVQIPNGNGTYTPGTMIGGNVVPNK